MEIENGCDGAWVAHPGLVQPVKKLFQNEIDDNQINIFKTIDIRSQDLLNPNIDNNDNFLISTEENIKKILMLVYNIYLHGFMVMEL